MSARPVLALIGVMAIHLSEDSAATAQTLQPIKPWVLHFDRTECVAERIFRSAPDTIVLGVRASPTGETYEIIVGRHGGGSELATQVEGSLDFGSGPIKTWVLRYAVRDTRLRIEKLRATSIEMAQARTAKAVTVHVKGEPDTTFALRAMPDLLKGFKQCTAALRTYWNMNGLADGTIAQPAQVNVRRLFSNRDYPDEATNRLQEGSATFLLFIDETGTVANCDVLKPSTIPAFNVMGCQVIRKARKFRPAVGRDGFGIRSTVITPPVVWRMAG